MSHTFELPVHVVADVHLCLTDDGNRLVIETALFFCERPCDVYPVRIVPAPGTCQNGVTLCDVGTLICDVGEILDGQVRKFGDLGQIRVTHWGKATLVGKETRDERPLTYDPSNPIPYAKLLALLMSPNGQDLRPFPESATLSECFLQHSGLHWSTSTGAVRHQGQRFTDTTHTTFDHMNSMVQRLESMLTGPIAVRFMSNNRLVVSPFVLLTNPSTVVQEIELPISTPALMKICARFLHALVATGQFRYTNAFSDSLLAIVSTSAQATPDKWMENLDDRTALERHYLDALKISAAKYPVWHHDVECKMLSLFATDGQVVRLPLSLVSSLPPATLSAIHRIHRMIKEVFCESDSDLEPIALDDEGNVCDSSSDEDSDEYSDSGSDSDESFGPLDLAPIMKERGHVHLDDCTVLSDGRLCWGEHRSSGQVTTGPIVDPIAVGLVRESKATFELNFTEHDERYLESFLGTWSYDRVFPECGTGVRPVADSLSNFVASSDSGLSGKKLIWTNGLVGWFRTLEELLCTDDVEVLRFWHFDSRGTRLLSESNWSLCSSTDVDCALHEHALLVNVSPDNRSMVIHRPVFLTAAGAKSKHSIWLKPFRLAKHTPERSMHMRAPLAHPDLVERTVEQLMKFYKDMKGGVLRERTFSDRSRAIVFVNDKDSWDHIGTHVPFSNNVTGKNKKSQSKTRATSHAYRNGGTDVTVVLRECACNGH